MSNHDLPRDAAEDATPRGRSHAAQRLPGHLTWTLRPFWEPVGNELVLAVATYRLHGDGTASAHVGIWSLGPGPADEVRAEVERIVNDAWYD